MNASARPRDQSPEASGPPSSRFRQNGIVSLPLTVLLDWGDTLMRVLPYDGPMADWPEVETVTGAAPALAILCERARLIVVSNAQASRPDDVRRALARVGLAQYIADVITPTTVGVTKEDHAFWPAVLTYLDLDPAEVIVVGDSYDRDIVPAVRAGLRTVWLSAGQQWRLADRGLTIGTLADLPAAVRILAAEGR